MRNMAIIFSGLWMFVSIIAFGAYGIDKWKARRGRWRISERTLLLLALFLGAPGAALAMGIFRHKTRHWRFRLLVPAFCAGQALIFLKVWGIL